MKKRNYLIFQATLISISLDLYGYDVFDDERVSKIIEEVNNISCSIPNSSPSLRVNNRETNLPETLSHEESREKKVITIRSPEEYEKKYKYLKICLNKLNEEYKLHLKDLAQHIKQLRELHKQIKQEGEGEEIIYRSSSDWAQNVLLGVILNVTVPGQALQQLYLKELEKIHRLMNALTTEFLLQQDLYIKANHNKTIGENKSKHNNSDNGSFLSRIWKTLFSCFISFSSE